MFEIRHSAKGRGLPANVYPPSVLNSYASANFGDDEECDSADLDSSVPHAISGEG
jgi:hypothetical protein